MTFALKAARAALKAYPELTAENQKLATENEGLRRRERVRNLQKVAEQRTASLPDESDLLRMPDEKLAGYELALELCAGAGSLALGNQERDGEDGVEAGSVKVATDLDGRPIDPVTAFMMDPMGFDAEGYAERYEQALEQYEKRK